MSEGIAPIDDRETGPAEAGTDLLDALGDECSRRILVTTSERPMTVQELTERCPVSSTTVYRRLNRLVDLGLLREQPAFPASGASKKRYEATVDRIETTIDGDGISVRRYTNRSDHDRIASLLSEAQTGQVEASIEDGKLHLSVPLNGTLFGAVAESATVHGDDDDE